jgi:hypothetical protein
MTEQQTAEPPQMVSVKEAARQLDIGIPRFYELLHAGHFSDITYPSETGTRQTRKVRQAEIDAFIDRNTNRPVTQS